MEIQPGNARDIAAAAAAPWRHSAAERRLASLRPHAARGYRGPAQGWISALAAIALAVVTLEATVAAPAKFEALAPSACTAAPHVGETINAQEDSASKEVR